MDYHEPRGKEIKNSLDALHNICFEGKVIGFKNLGLAVRNHDGVLLNIHSMSSNIFNTDTTYCFSYDSTNNTLFLILEYSNVNYNEHIYKEYTLKKEINSDTLKVYDWDNKFVKEFILTAYPFRSSWLNDFFKGLWWSVNGLLHQPKKQLSSIS
jgi:hypothetical protein